MDERCSVLVVDDDDIDRRAAVRALRSTGNVDEIQEAITCSGAVALMQSQQFDCAFFDHQLPDGDAFSLLAAMRRSGIHTPVVVLTGHGDERLAVELMKAGAADYFTKERLSTESVGQSLRHALRVFSAEEAVRRHTRQIENQQKWLESVINLLPLPTVFVQPGTNKITFSNRAALASSPLPCSAKDAADGGQCLKPDGEPVPAEQMPASRVARGELISGEELVCIANGESRSYIVSAETVPAVHGHPPMGVMMFQDVSRLKRIEEELRRKNEEIEGLNVRLQRAMAETHHRVKNNLQVISALISMQTSRGDATISRSEIERLGHHVRALATVHDLLTYEVKSGGSAETLSIRETLDKLMPAVREVYGDKQVQYDIAEVNLSVKHATSLAVLVNELVSNAVKHGGSMVHVSFDVSDCEARLVVEDDGPGFEPGFSPSVCANTGLELVQSLAAWDLGGDVTYENRPQGGARVCVTFPATAVTHK